MGTLRVVSGQRADLAAAAKHPWNGQFVVEGADAELTLRLLIVRRQQALHGSVVHNRGGKVYRTATSCCSNDSTSLMVGFAGPS